MSKAAQVVKSRKNLKPFIARNRKAPPFADKIPFIRSLILDSVEPGTIKKIYLFGSYAYGKPTSKSDIDLCVVIGDELDRSDVSLKIARCLYDHDIIPVDLMVYKENVFFNTTNPNGIEKTILTEGSLLYG